MKRIAPSTIGFGVVGSDGVAYKLNLSANRKDTAYVVVDSAGTGYKALLKDANPFSFGLADASGSSFKTVASVLPALTVDEGVQVTVIEYLSFSLAFKRSLPDSFTAEAIGFSNTTSESILVDQNIYQSGLDILAIPISASAKTLGRYSGGSVKKSFDVSYAKLRATKEFSVGYLIIQQLTKDFLFERALLYPLVKEVDLVFPLRLLTAYTIPSYDIIKTTRVQQAVQVSFSAILPLVKEIVLEKALLMPVVTSFEVSYVTALKFSFGVTYRIPTNVKREFSVAAPMVTRVQSGITVSAENHIKLRSSASFSYAILSGVKREFGVEYRSFNRMAVSYDFLYAINDTNRVTKAMPISYLSLREIHTVINAPVVGTIGTQLVQTQSVDIISVEPVIVVDGEYVYVEQMTISIDEGNFAYTIDATLINYADFARFSANKEFHASIQGEVYHFIVDSKSIDRQEVNAPKAVIRGLSPTTMLTGSRSKQVIGITYDENSTAKELAFDLATNRYLLTYTTPTDPDPWWLPTQASFHWEILDWGIPAYRFGVENQYPLDAVKLLAEVVGGVVEAYPSGELRVRYKHPVAVPDYSDAVVSHSFIDTEDVLSLNERHSPNKKVNSIYVKTYQDIGVQDRIEFFDVLNGEPNTHLPNESATMRMGGFVRVFPAVWRDSVLLEHSKEGNSDVELIYLGVEEWYPYAWQYPDYGWETIEIKQSQGSARYPIHEVVDYFYYDKDCGAPLVQDYSNTFYTDHDTNRYGLLRLKYKTRCHTWQVKCPGGTRMQFVVKDTVFNSYLR